MITVSPTIQIVCLYRPENLPRWDEVRLTSGVLVFTLGISVGAGLLFALGLFPGGNFYLGLVLILPMTLAYSYAYGLLTAAIPRTGGDYTLISRILHPALGVVATVDLRGRRVARVDRFQARPETAPLAPDSAVSHDGV